MMLSSAFRLFLIVFAAGAASAASSAENIIILKHNPFNKPKNLATPAPKVERKKETFTTDTLPRLTAILISDTMPMVIADNKMLKPGEEINGYHLLSVHKGEAIFEKLGKKYTLLLEDSQSENELQ